MWGDSQVTYSATARNQNATQAQTYVPPAIPMMTLGTPSPVESGPLVTKVKVPYLLVYI